MAIRTDRPAPPPPKPATPAPAGPPPLNGADAVGGTSRVDGTSDIDGVEGIDDVAQQSVLDGVSTNSVAGTAALSGKAAVDAAQPTRLPAIGARNAEQTADIKDTKSVSKLILDAATSLAPGESVALGGKIAAGEGVVVEGGVAISVTKRADGRFDVKIAQATAVGIGELAGWGDVGEKSKLLVGAGKEAVFNVATSNDAAELMAKFAAATAAGQVPGMSGVSNVLFDYATRDSLVERKFAATGEFEIEGEALVKLGMKDGASLGLVEAPPGKWFVEVEGELAGKAGMPTDDGLIGNGKGKGSIKGTVRLPIAAPDVADLASADGYKRLLDGALAKVKDATVDVEFKGSISKPGSSGMVTATKQVKLAELDTLFTTAGWRVSGDVFIGPKEQSTMIAAGEVEVTATRSYRTYQHDGGTLSDEVQKARAAVDSTQKATSGAYRQIK